MCKIVIVEEDNDLREKLKLEMAELFPGHEIVGGNSYRSKAYVELESAVDNLIETYTEKVEEHLNKKSFWR